MNAKKIGSGWHLSEDGYSLLSDNNAIKDTCKIIKNALDTDMKDFGSPILAEELKKNKTGQIVLQIQKVRNISAPKANEHSEVAARMLKFVLTDGHTHCQAIETTPVPGFSIDKTAPGSKILINNAKIVSGYILLEPSCCSFLGGRVTHLYEKWELSKNVKLARNPLSSDGPPAWVNFGAKIVSSNNDKSFKALDTTKDVEKNNTEFNIQRQEAIAEVTTGAVKKSFGGGNKQLPSAQTNHRRFDNREKNPENEMQGIQNNARYKGKGKREKVIDEKVQKPPERVSLFDFLEDKLPNSTESDTLQNSYKKESLPCTTKSEINTRNTNAFKNNTEENNRHYNYKSNTKPIHTETKSSTSNKYISNKNDVTASFEKMSISSNNNFASRSLRQHLNLSSKVTSDSNADVNWKVGDRCLAKYWEDGKFYKATITDVTPKTCVVQFNDYGNVEEVLKNDCVTSDSRQKFNANRSNSSRQYTGGAEFRRRKQY